MGKQEIAALTDEETPAARRVLLIVGEAEDFARGLLAAVIPESFNGVGGGPFCPRIKILVGRPSGPVLGVGGFAILFK